MLPVKIALACFAAFFSLFIICTLTMPAIVHMFLFSAWLAIVIGLAFWAIEKGFD